VESGHWYADRRHRGGFEPCHDLRVTDYALPGLAVYPEGITEGPGATFYVGSLGDGTIYRGDTTTGEVTIVVSPNGDGRRAICGLDVDGYAGLSPATLTEASSLLMT
jgi:hypothetical protein